jgi:hypothetical protein
MPSNQQAMLGKVLNPTDPVRRDLADERRYTRI